MIGTVIQMVLLAFYHAINSVLWSRSAVVEMSQIGQPFFEDGTFCRLLIPIENVQ